MVRKTILIDIDGTTVNHGGDLNSMILNDIELPAGTVDKFMEWHDKEYHIVITTARPESMRELTTQQLNSVGLFFDQMVMGLPHGPRILINDEKPNGMITAKAYCIKRNSGVHQVEE